MENWKRKKQLEQIGNHVKRHLRLWIEEENVSLSRETDRELLERIITIEQQIRFQNEKFELILAQMDKRFEDMQHNMDKRFDQVDKRFNQMFWFGTIGITALAALMSVYQFIG